MKVLLNTGLLLIMLVLAGASLVYGTETQIPTGMFLLDTATQKGALKKADQGYPTIAADVGMGYLWLGRDGGLRRYDQNTDEWKFFKYDEKKCPGRGTINVLVEPPYVWARIGSTGRLCRLSPDTGEWLPMDHWTVLQHTGTGFPIDMDKYHYYVASSGGPDWEGISIIDRDSMEWMKLHKTKPPTTMYVDDKFIWTGVSEGILRIDKITEEYRYFQPFEHGGGALVKDIVPLPGGRIAFATFGTHTGILGDELVVGKYFIKVYMKASDKWYTYGKNEREKLLDDIQKGKIVVTNIDTHPGLLLLKDKTWELMDSRHGLPSNDVLDLEKDDRFLYVSTAKGIVALDLKSMKPAVLNRNISNSIRQVRRVIADKEYLWVFSNKGLYRIVKRMLFSDPRPQTAPENAIHNE